MEGYCSELGCSSEPEVCDVNECHAVEDSSFLKKGERKVEDVERDAGVQTEERGEYTRVSDEYAHLYEEEIIVPLGCTFQE